MPRPDPFHRIVEARMRAFLAAAGGLALAVLLVLAVTATGEPGGGTSPRPLLTTVPTAPGP
ncbi:SPW_0924 family protein [Streptomyces sp. NPDC051567]|uniref:SPW_0924 family protein n=1 Tax=Streptomyces sp. NPDC051567 TaxID=3365660 RepID=UPI0037BC230F